MASEVKPKTYGEMTTGELMDIIRSMDHEKHILRQKNAALSQRLDAAERRCWELEGAILLHAKYVASAEGDFRKLEKADKTLYLALQSKPKES